MWSVILPIMRTFPVLVLSAPLLIGLPSHADALDDWSKVMLESIREESIGPNLAVRNFAILHGASFDALNAIDRKFKPYHFAEPFGSADAVPEAMVAGSCHTIASNLHPSRKGSFDKLAKPFLSQAPDSPAGRSFAFGVRVGRSFLKLRASDGSSTKITYRPTSETGQWRRTPPRYRPPVQPHWRNVKPFCLPSLAPYLAPPPPGIGSKEFAKALAETKLIGSTDSVVRTAKQKLIARFWSDFSYTATPPGHWNQIAGSVARLKKLGLHEKARLFALLNYTLADAGIAAFEAKYRYHLWRPVDAIRLAHEVPSTARLRDKRWSSFLETPAHPEYVSGHSCYSGAGARLLALYFGTDSISFVARSDGLPGVQRSFTSFSSCAEEIGKSRLYGGIHYDFSNRNGIDMGKKIADYAFRNLLPESLPNN